MPPAPIRRLCGTIARLGPAGPLPSCVLAGRVAAIDASSARLVLQDRSGGVTVVFERGTVLPEPGTLVEALVTGLVEAGVARGASWRPLVAGQQAERAGTAGAEHLRLHRPEGGATRGERLVRRGRALAAVRELFTLGGYLEVQTPCRVRSPGLEPHLVAEPAGDGYLITSPEYHMKRLLAGGLERIYLLGPCWRRDERGPHHLGEFTMIEWYRGYSDTDELMDETEALVRHVARRLGHEPGRASSYPPLIYQGRPLDLSAPFARITVAEAVGRWAGVDVVGVTEAADLAGRVRAAGLDVGSGDPAFDELFSRLLVERVEPAMARLPGPVFLTDFPAPLAALSRLKEPDRVVADRFELYAGGLELANAFGELTDAAEQRDRLLDEQRARRAAGAEVYPIDEPFLAALAEGIPPTAGIALGFDRLLMLLCDAASIDQVVAFAPDEV